VAKKSPVIPLLPAPREIRILPGVCRAPIRARIDAAALGPQGYRISLSPDRAEIVAADSAGLFYARQTLLQLRRVFPRNLPCLELTDFPDFPVRGVMLDISRDKVPTMASLRRIVDELAAWKINQLQLYTEHTFAYLGHETVWKSASPMTPAQIRSLDRYCQRRFIELVPNQNSLGHMYRWLRHKKYRTLSEAADGSITPWGFRWPGPFSLCPIDPKSLRLLRDLYAQLLPNFSSKLFNVGCDETFDIGQGRSKNACRRRGVAAVYLDFLKQIQKLVRHHDRRMMFWADVVLHHPKLIRKIPRDAIALLWGYEADHDFPGQAAVLRRAKIPFYICPGTSSWCSIAGRTANMLANQKNAAAAGIKNGAIGYLNTDWGDFGHLQPWPIFYPGLAAGACVSWCLKSNRDVSLAEILDAQVFFDSSKIVGGVLADLGNVYRAIGKLFPNRSALFSLLVPSSWPRDPMKSLTKKRLQNALKSIDAAIAPLDRAAMDRPDAALIRYEILLAAAMLRHACRKGLWRLTGRPKSVELAGELRQIIAAHKKCWRARNRPGGLGDSVARLADNFGEYLPASRIPAKKK
jgi:hexosaminidase